MVLDHVESDCYVIQNNLPKYGGSSLKIQVNQEYYASADMLTKNPTIRDSSGRYLYENNGQKMYLVNEKINDMKLDTFYLLPQAYSFKLTKK